jgi:hypothetical protein
LILGGTKQWYHKMANVLWLNNLRFLIIWWLACCHQPKHMNYIVEVLDGSQKSWEVAMVKSHDMCCSTSNEVCHPKICKHRPYFWFLCRTTTHNNQYMELMDNNRKHRTWALKLPSQKKKMHITYKTCEWSKCKHPSLMRKMMLGGYLTLLITASSGYVKTIQESQWFSCMNWPCKGGYLNFFLRTMVI